MVNELRPLDGQLWALSASRIIGRVSGDDADERQFAERIGDIHAVADDEIIGTLEADIVGLQLLLALHALVQEDGDRDIAGTALVEQLLGEKQRAAGFENIVEQQDIAPLPVAGDNLDESPALRTRSGPLARQTEKIELRS